MIALKWYDRGAFVGAEIGDGLLAISIIPASTLEAKWKIQIIGGTTVYKPPRLFDSIEEAQAAAPDILKTVLSEMISELNEETPE